MAHRPESVEWLACRSSFAYFVDTYVRIYDALVGEWIPFKLWPEQEALAETLTTDQLVAVLKARQLGITWLCLAYLLWLMIFKPSATCLVFSRRETEASYLMERLRGIYHRLPSWAQAREIVTDNALVFQLSNGSIAYGFPTTAGDSYTATAALVDETDLVPDLDRLMGAVKPTIDAGGKMILISRSDKSNPSSPFKNIFRAAIEGRNNYTPVFIPWYARPGRTAEWYEDVKNEIFSRTGSLDELWEQYPATADEALRARELDKRFPPDWITRRFHGIPATVGNKVSIPGLSVYFEPQANRAYIIGADPAEGNPTSDDSVAVVLDKASLEEVAILKGKIEPGVMASYLLTLSDWYNFAQIMPERNNHGHVLISHLPPSRILEGPDRKPGWHTNAKSKADMYSEVAAVFADKIPTIHTVELKDQLMSIEGASLEAPKGLHDDMAVAFACAVVGARLTPATATVRSYLEAEKSRPKNRREALAQNWMS